jgi:hypothetical protein
MKRNEIQGIFEWVDVLRGLEMTRIVNSGQIFGSLTGSSARPEFVEGQSHDSRYR